MQQVCVCVCGFARMDSRNLITSAAWHAAHLAGKFGYLGRANKTCFVQGKRAHLRRRDLLVSGPRLLLHWALLPAHFSSAVPGQQRRVHVVSRNTSGSCRKAPCFHRPALRTAKQLFLFLLFSCLHLLVQAETENRTLGCWPSRSSTPVPCSTTTWTSSTTLQHHGTRKHHTHGIYSIYRQNQCIVYNQSDLPYVLTIHTFPLTCSPTTRSGCCGPRRASTHTSTPNAQSLPAQPDSLILSPHLRGSGLSRRSRGR